MDFFQKNCQEPTLNIPVFGLCDDRTGLKAYTNSDTPEKWIATVINEKQIMLTFTAIDKCVIPDDVEPHRGRCDGMLTSDENIIFVELKDEIRGWVNDAIEQLESTIQFFIANHNIHAFRHKKAYACNKKHRHFQEIDNELNLHFFRNYGVRIDVQAQIIVI